MLVLERHKQTVRVITDSVAQVPEDIAQELAIPIVPFVVTIHETSFEDGVDIQPEALYQRMRAEKVIPKTSAPSPGRYIQKFQEVIQQGCQIDPVCCPLIQSEWFIQCGQWRSRDRA